MIKGYFITGTDTDVGKTWIALGLLTLFKNKGLSTTVMKPISAGCQQTSAGLRNNDAVELIKHATVKPVYETVNPYAFEAAIAPHIAAQNNGIEMNIPTIKKYFDQLSKTADITIVEGAGGWKVPINKTETMADVAKALGLPVILVVGMKLGCLNHAILTVENMLDRKIEIAGWVANTLSPHFEEQQANIETLKTWLGIPLLGNIPYLKSIDERLVAQKLELTRHNALMVEE